MNISHILCLGMEPQLGMTQTRNSPVTTFSWTSSSPLLSSIKWPKGWANASMMILLPGSKKETHLELFSKDRDNPAAAGQRTQTTTMELLDSTLHCQVSDVLNVSGAFAITTARPSFSKKRGKGAEGISNSKQRKHLSRNINAESEWCSCWLKKHSKRITGFDYIVHMKCPQFNAQKANVISWDVTDWKYRIYTIFKIYRGATKEKSDLWDTPN